MKFTRKAWAIELHKSGGWGLGFDGPFPSRKNARERMREERTDEWKCVRVVRIEVTIEEIPSPPRPQTCT